jgi:hypothetical protein
VAVRQCVATCAAAVSGRLRGIVRQCVAVCGDAHDSVRQCTLHIRSLHTKSHNILIGMPFNKRWWD